MPRTLDSGAVNVLVATGLQEVTPAALAPASRDLLGQLVSLGVRMTSQRRLIIGLIQDVHAPLDAATLLQLARQRDAGVDRATVYRTLALLRRNGLIDGVASAARGRSSGERPAQPAVVSADQFRLTCLRCGAVEDLAPRDFDRLKSVIAGRQRVEIAVMRLEIRGACRSCARLRGIGSRTARALPRGRKRRK
jgi:Fur family transcriptional regulator, ferric uptake regulator